MTVQDDLINFRDGTTIFSLLSKNEGRFCCFCDKKTAFKLKKQKSCVFIHRKAVYMARAKVEESKKFIRKDISMDPEQYERLLLFCQREERSISWVIRKALDCYMDV